MTRYARYGYTEVSVQLIERADESVDVLGLAIDDAKRAAGITDEPYYVRVVVVEMVPVDDAEGR